MVIGLFFLMLNCSTQKDKFVNRQYHRLTTTFNVLFNGEEAFAIGKSILDASVEDNFFELLDVEPITLSGESLDNTTLVPGFDRAEDKAVKAIQKHSMRFEGEQRNNQIDKAYLLLGKARYFDRRFFPALEAFNFLMESYSSEASYLEGIIWREKTNIRLLNNEIAIGNLRPLARQLLPSNRFYGAVNATVAQAFINLKVLDSAQYYIAKAAQFENDKHLKGRYFFINGQLLEQLGKKEEAFVSYESILALRKKTARKYWIHAKIKQQIIQAQFKNINPEETLLGLLNKYDNQPYEHVIYRALGAFYLEKNQDSLSQAYLMASQKAPTLDEPTEKANLRDLADYYFIRGNYKKTEAYLDSLVRLLPEKTLANKRTRRERDNLEGILEYEKTIQNTDSLLHLMSLSKEQQRKFIKGYLEQKRKETEAAVAKNVGQGKKNRLFGLGKESKFYFYRPNLVAQGKQSFLASWGTRPNRDNWRLVQSMVAPMARTENQEEQEPIRIQLEDISSLMAQIPNASHTDSLKQLNHQSYLQAGLLYKEQFKNKNLARQRLDTLLRKRPQANIAAPALYHLYRIEEEDQRTTEAEDYRGQLLADYTESAFAQLLSNTEIEWDPSEDQPKRQYEKLLELYQRGKYFDALGRAKTLSVVLSATEWAPKIALIQANIKGKLEGQKAWVMALEEIQEKFPQSFAAKQSKGITLQLKSKGNKSKKVFALYKWVFPHHRNESLGLEKDIKILNEAIENLKSLKLSIDSYSQNYAFVVVHGFRSPEELSRFQEELQAKEPNFNSNNFVVLSHEYQEIQLNKSWKPTQKQTK